jgi:ferredoxin
MTSTVTLTRSGVSFIVQGRQTILDGALAAGLDLDYSCRQGICGTCKALILSGEVMIDADPDVHLAIGPKAIARGYRLLCISVPLSPVLEIDL